MKCVWIVKQFKSALLQSQMFEFSILVLDPVICSYNQQGDEVGLGLSSFAVPPRYIPPGFGSANELVHLEVQVPSVSSNGKYAASTLLGCRLMNSV